MHALVEENEEFVVRAKHDRYTGKTHRAREQRLWDLLAESEPKGCMTPIIQDVNSRETKEITLTLKAIEDYHKVLKTGYQIDEIYLHSSRETIKNLIIMASISACRLYWLIYIGRTEANIKADQLFEDFEWKAIYVYFKEIIPKECPVLSEVILRIARLGSHKKTKNGATKTQ